MEDAAHTPDTQLFSDVFNASPIGIAIENLDGQPLFVNPAFCSMLGFSEEDCVASIVWIFPLLKMLKRTGHFFSNCEQVR